MSNKDQIQRILFDNIDVRGVITSLDQSFQDIMARHNYPVIIEQVLGEMLAAVTILSTNLKFNGKLILQAKGEGCVSTLMAECNHLKHCRAIAQFDESIPAGLSFKQMLAEGHLVLTIEPEVGQRYQGYVPLENDTLAECLADYFDRSEQLQSKFVFACENGRARGLMLQVLPAMKSAEDDWSRLSMLTQTLTVDELLSLDNETLLFRLFHDEQCRLFEGQNIEFKCQCSRERSESALKLLANEELLDIIAERSFIEIDCQFCNSNYSFDASDVNEIILKKELDSEQLH
ncbi:MAG: hsp33 protein [Osedax symbiont Rs1]|nr:MAG: hsp33 protein [Osedax symbiont Rs1]